MRRKKKEKVRDKNGDGMKGNGQRMAFVGVISSLFAHLVIPPEKRDVTGKFQLQAKEEAQRLDRVVSLVDKVAQEHKGAVRGPPSHLWTQQLEQVVELPVQVAHNCHGGQHRLDVRLLHQQLGGRLAQLAEGSFG